jgi:hypothetical protein
MKIQHQLKESDIYIPAWNIKHLFIGTFNPEGGEKVNYYYGRSKNQTWNILSKIFNEDFNPSIIDSFLPLIQKHGIGCIDLIDSLESETNQLSDIIGKGYKDSKIINTKVKRVYNTPIILEMIRANPSLKVYSTWGKGSKLKEWINEVSVIPNLINLTSPSLAARVPKGKNKFEYMLSDWENKIGL